MLFFHIVNVHGEVCSGYIPLWAQVLCLLRCCHGGRKACVQLAIYKERPDLGLALIWSPEVTDLIINLVTNSNLKLDHSPGRHRRRRLRRPDFCFCRT